MNPASTGSFFQLTWWEILKIRGTKCKSSSICFAVWWWVNYGVTFLALWCRLINNNNNNNNSDYMHGLHTCKLLLCHKCANYIRSCVTHMHTYKLIRSITNSVHSLHTCITCVVHIKDTHALHTTLILCMWHTCGVVPNFLHAAYVLNKSISGTSISGLFY